MPDKKELQNITVATRITKPMHEEILGILASNAHVNMADYLRDVIRRDLESRMEKEANKGGN